VNNIQGPYPISERLPGNESKITPPLFVEQIMSEIIEQKFHIDGNAIAKTILFVCIECGGPTAPLASCFVCRRTSQRQCTKCRNKVSYGSHMSCEYLAYLGKYRSNGYDSKKKNEVNL
jgi:hypothetical protein